MWSCHASNISWFCSGSEILHPLAPTHWATSPPRTHPASFVLWILCAENSDSLVFFSLRFVLCGGSAISSFFRDKTFLFFNPLGLQKWQSSGRWEWKSVPAFMRLLSPGSRCFTPKCTDKTQTAFHYRLSVPPVKGEGVLMHRPKRLWLDFEPGCSFRGGNWNIISPRVGECYTEREETWFTPNVLAASSHGMTAVL